MFDSAEILIKAGDGGDGAVTFRREKFVPYGGPNGGDGGKGGDVYLTADNSLNGLQTFKMKKSYKARNGEKGRGSKQHGANGADTILTVPVGTIVMQNSPEGEKVLLADLSEDGQRFKAAKGGRGGMGNIHFASPVHQTPRIAEKGGLGEEKTLLLELRLLADVGIVGNPNAGKSSLLAAVSAAKPKIADYPFTTLEPIVGVVGDEKGFVMAEIPGLIEGAHLGKGLGHSFLRHALRTRVLILLVDGSSPSPTEDMLQVNNELNLYDPTLARKPQLLAVNKIDLPEVQSRIEEIRSAFTDAGITPFFISAATGAGLAELITGVQKLLKANPMKKFSITSPEVKEFKLQPKPFLRKIQRQGRVFIVSDPQLEKLVGEADMTIPGASSQLNRQLDILGITETLVKAGIKQGDAIYCRKREWKWYRDEDRTVRRNVRPGAPGASGTG